MNKLNLKAFAGLLGLFIIMAAALFLPAWTFSYWQAWTFLAIFFLFSFAITLYLMKKDPKLLERRVHAGPTAEKETSQKIIQSISSFGFISLLVIPAFDHRFAWTVVPFWFVVAGDVLVALGFLIVSFVYKENTFTSATIEIYPGQKVITTGLYSIVRHPMYMGAVFLLFGIPLSLGSWLGLVGYIIIISSLIWRIFDEEKLLMKSLPDYIEYQNIVTYRLIPFVW